MKILGKLNIAIHVILILIGTVMIIVASNFLNEVWQAPFINIGSDLIAVTTVFFVFQVFGASSDDESKDLQETKLLKDDIKDLKTTEVEVEEELESTKEIKEANSIEQEDVPEDLKNALKGRSKPSQTKYPRKDY